MGLGSINLLKGMNQVKGFTLIELVVVIVVLGVLSVTAVPKFIDLTGDSRKSVMQGLKASIQSATNLIHAKALIANKISGSGVVEANGVYYAVVNSYPSTHNIGTGSGDSAENASGIIYSVETDIRLNIQMLTGNGIKQAIFYYADSGFGCQITYYEASSVNEPPEITTFYSYC